MTNISDSTALGQLLGNALNNSAQTADTYIGTEDINSLNYVNMDGFHLTGSVFIYSMTVNGSGWILDLPQQSKLDTASNRLDTAKYVSSILQYSGLLN